MTDDCDLSWYLYISLSGLYDEWSGLCEQWLVAGRVVVVATVSVKFLQSWREVRSDREISCRSTQGHCHCTGTLRPPPCHNNKHPGLAWISQLEVIAR